MGDNPCSQLSHLEYGAPFLTIKHTPMTVLMAHRAASICHFCLHWLCLQFADCAYALAAGR